MNSLRLRRIGWTLTLVYACFHFVMTHLPVGNVPVLPGADKTWHFLSYGLLSGCFYLTLWMGGMPVRRTALMVVFAAALFGLFDEILQAPVGREPELLDWIVDVAGAIVAATCLSLLRIVLARRARESSDAQPPLVFDPEAQTRRAVSQDS